MKPVYLMIGPALLGACLSARAQDTNTPEQNRTARQRKCASARDPAAGGANKRADDEKAIAALVAAFTKAFNAGDAAAAAATFAEDALVVDEHGERTEGRAAIRDQLAASFADNPGSTIAIKVDSLRFLGPDTALEEGRTTITPAGRRRRRRSLASPSSTSRTTAGGSNPPSATSLPMTWARHDRLKELEWLVGDWINESQDAVVSTSCKWTDDGNFLVREFTMKTQGQPVLSGTQRIGWDAVEAPVQDLDLRLRRAASARATGPATATSG